MRKINDGEFMLLGGVAMGLFIGLSAPFADVLPPLAAMGAGAICAALLVFLYVILTSGGKK